MTKPIDEPLYVVSTVFNPRRYRSRYKLYEDFAHYVECSGGIHYTVEVAFGERPWEVTEAGNPRHLQLRSKHEIWLKERALNLVVQRLPVDWKYVAVVDADVTFARPDWIMETKHQLQHNPVLQMFEEAVDLGPKYEILNRHQGFVACYRKGLPFRPTSGYPYNTPFYHPGFAWAYTRDAWDELGGLIDFGVLGAGDHHMACALVGQVDRSMPPDICPGYRESCRIWQERARASIMGHLGYLETTLLHNWHGKKANRKYVERWELIRSHQYDPELDLRPDYAGLWQLTDRKPAFRRACQDYFSQRLEDSMEV